MKFQRGERGPEQSQAREPPRVEQAVVDGRRFRSQVQESAGQTVDVDLSDAEAKVAKSTEWFDFSGKATAENKAEDKK